MTLLLYNLLKLSLRNVPTSIAVINIACFSRTALFFLLSLSSLIFLIPIAASVHMSEVWLLNFLRSFGSVVGIRILTAFLPCVRVRACPA